MQVWIGSLVALNSVVQNMCGGRRCRPIDGSRSCDRMQVPPHVLRWAQHLNLRPRLKHNNIAKITINMNTLTAN